jgi:SAM-dependent methyltransferase
VKLGDLRPTDKVLEIGCGIGRMAVPLTQYLSTGTYDGMDVVAEGINWCGQNITPAYPAFRFHHMDVANDLYNPQGRIDPSAVTLPFADQGFDFILLTSVLTHLQATETLAYAWEISRMLRTGGRCFLSLFLMNDCALEGLRSGGNRLTFNPDEVGPTWLANPEIPSAAVAHDEEFLLDMFANVGLKPAKPIVYGTWCGRPNAVSYQDLLVLEKAGSP